MSGRIHSVLKSSTAVARISRNRICCGLRPNTKFPPLMRSRPSREDVTRMFFSREKGGKLNGGSEREYTRRSPPASDHGQIGDFKPGKPAPHEPEIVNVN